MAALEKHGVPCSPYVTVTEALKDPQVEHRGSLCTIEDSAGKLPVARAALPLLRLAAAERPQGRRLGEDTKSVLARGRPERRSEIEALVK